MILLVAGCAMTPRHNADHVSDWQDLDNAPPAASSTTFAPPPPMPTNPPPTIALPAPDTAEPSGRSYPTWVSLQEWAHARGLVAPTRINPGPPPTYAVKSANGLLVLSAGSVIAHWDGLELRLGFAPQLINGLLYVHGLDLRKTLQPLLQGASPPLSPGAVLVIDPGHGGADAGTKSVVHSYYEKDFTLDWALRLQALMTARGCQVFLTRSNDADIALSNRVAFATQHNANVFLSLHFNSAGQDSYEAGLETYCLTPAGMPSSLTRGFADEVSWTFPNNAFDAQNLRLALSVHRALLQVNGHLDRGVRRARFPTVLRGQQRPAVLIEGGYLSNRREAEQIAEPGYRQRLAEAVARALLSVKEVASPRFSNGPAPGAATNQDQAAVKNSLPVEKDPSSNVQTP